MLRWSGDDLVKKSGVSLSTVRRLEAANGVPESANLKTVIAIQQAFESAGVEFIGSPDQDPGVRLKTKRP